MTDNSPTYGQADASYQAVGGLEGIRQLVTDFYQEMDSWEGARELRALHAEDLTLAREKLTAFLSGWLGGPRLFQQQFGSISIPAFHARWAVGPELRDQWLDCMARAIARQAFHPAFASYLLEQLRVPANRVVQASQAMRQAQQ
ncbi:globin [Halopseudomonas pachastrellae]|uniref:Globin n=1 Tax=Halopseudomonas pachastrellae TaxID=254161 RepID=A0A1S8DKU3_9GAMM|nr:group II truncated hemoglobin [Halopseudomonas pachastrellae]ONM44987.1 globin [Halopseudomonas pachastrellae]SFM19293.1 hemoglobin [Halopseudomonas pachastrellae]